MALPTVTTDVRACPAHLADNARYQTACVAIDAALQAVGMVPVSQTGQIADLSVLTRPTASTYSGWRCYRLPDSALQTACPGFIKVEYGVGGSQTVMLLRFTFGTGLDGSGTFTGFQSSSTFTLTPAVGSSAEDRNLIVSGSAWHLHFMIQRSSTNSTGRAVTFERACINGEATDKGFFIHGTANVWAEWQVLPRMGTIPSKSSNVNLVPPISFLSTSSAGAVGAQPARFMVSGNLCDTMHHAYKVGDLIDLDVLDGRDSDHPKLPWFDKQLTMLPLGLPGTAMANDTSNTVFAFLWA